MGGVFFDIAGQIDKEINIAQENRKIVNRAAAMVARVWQIIAFVQLAFIFQFTNWRRPLAISWGKGESG